MMWRQSQAKSQVHLIFTPLIPVSLSQPDQMGYNKKYYVYTPMICCFLINMQTVEERRTVIDSDGNEKVGIYLTTYWFYKFSSIHNTDNSDLF